MIQSSRPIIIFFNYFHYYTIRDITTIVLWQAKRHRHLYENSLGFLPLFHELYITLTVFPSSYLFLFASYGRTFPFVAIKANGKCSVISEAPTECSQSTHNKSTRENLYEKRKKIVIINKVFLNISYLYRES